jgi:hypothetical protein
MNIRIVINSLIIIFILHIIILNINFTYNIGKKNNIEGFYDSNNKEKKDSMSFLTNNDSNEDFKKKMEKYIQQDNEINNDNKFEEKNINKVSPSNTYLDNNNFPNFESNVADTKKFYKINYDNLNENELKETSIDTLKNYDNLNIQNKTKEVISIDPQSKQPCNIKNYGRESTTLPDTWSYKDELPMNGGKMNGIFGFDSLESQFAIFNPNKLNLQSVKDDNFENIPQNDLRKPIIYEN